MRSLKKRIKWKKSFNLKKIKSVFLSLKIFLIKYFNILLSTIKESKFYTNWDYKLYQKVISWFLIFFILFNLAFSVPFKEIFTKEVFAENRPFYNLVSVIVEEDIYPQVSEKLKRYAKDVESVLDKSRVVIIPTQKDVQVFEISSLLESLYYEWYKSVNKDADFESKLVWTVLVWDLPIPIVKDLENYSKTIVPYTDFENKTYVYNQEKEVYEKSLNWNQKIEAEIWHGLINPNKQNRDENIKAINDYFDKNHDYYKWEGLFKNSDWIMNWNFMEDPKDNYVPHIFYFDRFREIASINSMNYNWYKSYQENREDLIYNRHNKELATKVSDQVFWWEEAELEQVLQDAFSGTTFAETAAKADTWWLLTESPDILTRYSTSENDKNFVEIFNFSALADLRKNIYNAWRYSWAGDEVNAHMIPFLITVLDLVSDQTIKNVNDNLEKTIDDAIKNWWQNDVRIFENYSHKKQCEEKFYENYFYGVKTKDITKAEQCSIYRWSLDNSWSLIMANRWYNVTNMTADYDLIWDECIKKCKWDTLCMTRWYWWWNSPLNLNEESVETKSLDYDLNEHKLKWSITPLLDVVWSRKSTDASKIHSPWDCKFWVWILTKNVNKECETTYDLEKKIWFSCDTDVLAPWTVNFNDFTDVADWISVPWTCNTVKIYVSWILYKSWEQMSENGLSSSNCTSDAGAGTESGTREEDSASTSCDNLVTCTFRYKVVNSQIQHESPTSAELKKQVNWLVWTTLPIDRDKYTDFFWRDDKLKKIKYPYLFRLNLEDNKENNFKNNDEALKKYLWEQSKKVNDTVRSAAASGPGLMARYKNVDLYKTLKDTPLKVFKLDWEEKEINYYDTLVFAMYWKNIDTISEKYKFILENYLSDQFNSKKNQFKFGLPKNKKVYEISYMWAPWNVSNMYIQMDPEAKIQWNPYTQDQAKLDKLENELTWLNLWNSTFWSDFDLASSDSPWEEESPTDTEDSIMWDWWEANFECWPPEWVPIWRWLPAIMCRLETMLPPKIKFSTTKCASQKWFLDYSTKDQYIWEFKESPDNQETWFPSLDTWWTSWNQATSSSWSETQSWITTCEWDFDKNWINDCIENALKWWKLELNSNSSKYYYNEMWEVKAVLKDSSWKVIYDDSYTKINFELEKLDIVNEDSTKTTIFDRKNDEAVKIIEAQKYFNFEWNAVPAEKWEARYSFTSKDKDVDVYLRAWINVLNFKWETTIFLEDSVKFEVRWINFVTTDYKIEKSWTWWLDVLSWLNSWLVSDTPNLYLFDWNNWSIEDKKEEIDKLSSSKEKIIFALENYSKDQKPLNLKYPIIVNLYDEDWEHIINNKIINSWDLQNPLALVSLKKSWEYRLEFEDSENYKIYKNFVMLADKASQAEINLWSNIAEIWWVVTTNFVVLYDKFWNIAEWDLYEVDATIDGKWIKFISESTENYDFIEKLEFPVMEWFKIFRLKTTDDIWANNIIFNVKDTLWNPIFTSKKEIKTVENVVMSVSPLQNEIKIWWWEYGFSFKLMDKNWKVMNDLNSRMYLWINDIFWRSKKVWFDVKNGEWEVKFTTKTVSSKDVKLSFQVEWFNQIYTKYIDILPEKPIKLDLVLNKSKIESNPNDYAILRAELKDRYGNLVFNDNTTNLILELRSQYKEILNPEKTSVVVKEWIWTFKINATEKAGNAYVKVKANPDFTWSFKIDWQWPFPKTNLTLTWFTDQTWLTDLWSRFFEEYDSWNYIFKIHKISDLENIPEFKTLPELDQSSLKDLWEITNSIWIDASSQSVVKIETFYFWNKEKIQWRYYNSLYTVLLWAEYWDVTQKDYLAWSLLFEKENRALSVTSLLNNPYNYFDIVSINSKWKIQTIENNEDLTQDIRYIANIWEDRKLSFDMYNDALSTYIWKIYYNLENNNLLKVCENDSNPNFINCEKDADKTSILLKSLSKSYTSELDWEKLILKDIYLNTIFSINNNWEIFLKNGLRIENFKWDEETWKNDESIFVIKEWEENIASFSYNIINWKINLTRDKDLLPAKLQAIKNAIVVYLNSNKYWDRLLDTKTSSALMVYYNDPYANENELNIFSNQDTYNLESFKENQRVWWAEWNKSLLLFSAWESVWESTKKYASFSLINLWDPVVSLKKVKVKLEQESEEPDCEEIEWLDWKDMCEREEVWSLDVSFWMWQIHLKQEITEILKDQTIVVENPVVWNSWIILKRDWKWYGSTWERMRPSQQSKLISSIDWEHIKKSAIPSNWEPRNGDVYWFFVSWLARMWTTNEKIKSPISRVKWGESEWSSHFNDVDSSGWGVCSVTTNENLNADFIASIQGIEPTSPTALQDLAQKFLDLGYDAIAYKEQNWWYRDKLNINWKIYDVLIVTWSSKWNPVPLPVREEETPGNCDQANVWGDENKEKDVKYRSFDKTTWIQITKDEDNVSYKTLDYNADWLKDLLVLKSTSQIELFENRWKLNFSSLWNLVYLPEIWSKWQIEAGDFTWDKFEDIFYISKWKPFLLNNTEKNFDKIPLDKQFSLTWSIVKAAAFDMDNDKKMDIVTMDSEWDLHIFYWSWTSDKPEFTKLKIGSWYSLFLNTEKKDWNWAISYDWIKNLSIENSRNQLLKRNETLTENGILKTTEPTINTNLIDWLIYDSIPTEAMKQEEDTIFNDTQLKNKNFKNSYIGIETQIDSLQNYSLEDIFSGSRDVPERTFIKNKYVNSFGFDIQKEYVDINTWSLNPLDMLEVTVKIKNTWAARKNVFYAEDIEDYFSFSDNEEDITISKDAKISYTAWNYNFMIYWFDLAAWETVTLKYEVQLAPLTYGELKVWYFEDWEDWDDEYGDLILKLDENVCSNEPDIFRSTWPRSYEKWIKELECKQNNLNFPKAIKQNTIDEDNNWVPDYIDKLLPTEQQKASWEYGDEYIKSVEDYSKKSLNNLNSDKDWDWIPSEEDSTPSYSNNNKDPQAFISTINDWIDRFTEWIDAVADWLCNWFWGWACISSPLNWAPLAPWNDPVLFWYPIANWLKVWEWLPLFSAMTDPCWYWKIWPVCPLKAGGIFDKPEWDWKVFIRLYITPTITWAVWLAICFWKNDMSKDRNPPWAYPLLKPKDWDCIIVAYPFLWCDWDWSDWDVKEKNYPINFSSAWWTWKSPLKADKNFSDWETATPYSVVNWSCVDSKEKTDSRDFKFDQEFVTNYLQYKESTYWTLNNWWVANIQTNQSTQTNQIKNENIKKMHESLNLIHKWDHVVEPSKPLIKIWEKWSTLTGSELWITVDINTSWLRNWDYKDVIQVKNKLIKSFNDFVMDWVDRQIEEIIVKLTSLPSLIIILPDFSWITDYDWTNFFSWLKDSFDKKDEQRQKNQENYISDLNSIENEEKTYKCWTPEASTYECSVLYLEKQRLTIEKDYNPNVVTSGIKWVYDFIWSLPIVKLESQRVNVNLPWITKSSLLKAKVDFDIAWQQRNSEIERAAKVRSNLDWVKKQAWDEIIKEGKALLRSLEKNKEVLESYWRYPEDLVRLLNKKEDRLNQIICNIETLYEIYWWRLKDNWKRFKAWVELYLLIKAALKSWQVILDLFDEYDKTCKECKNERYDLRTFIWSLISMIIPTVPVIEFPKWPNIILDLHNIRVWFVITLPEFYFKQRPIVIPSLPELRLPDVPSLDIKIPSLPILPSIEIPELPDLPNIPTAELPDLPPPPQLPKLLSAIEAVLKIVKLITKVQCIIQKTPFAPEWNAWVKIAYLTDRQWFAPFDFIDIDFPNFSYPFVDSINITSYINFEIESQFIVEFAKNWVKPLNNFTNDIVNLFNSNVPSLDFTNLVPNEVEVELNDQWVEVKPQSYNLEKWENKLDSLAKIFAYGIYSLYNYIDDNKNETLTNKEFLATVNKWLSSEEIASDPSTEKLRNIWKEVNSVTFSKEDKHIEDLQKKSKEKFDDLKNIIDKEIKLNKKQLDEVKILDFWSNIKLTSSISQNSNIKEYNEIMKKHNLVTMNATKNLLKWEDKEKDSIQKEWENLIWEVKTRINNSKQKLLAAETNITNSTNTINMTASWTWELSYSSTWSCAQYSQKWLNEYKYDYKWIYIIENWKNYRLFDYIDELSWDEKLDHADFDNDWDEEIIYMVKNELYIKENLQIKNKQENEINDALILYRDKNKFYNDSDFYEAVNNVKESDSTDWYISLGFDTSDRKDINSYRLEYFTIVDKSLNEDYDNYTPKWIKKTIIDSFEDIDEITLLEQKSQTWYKIRENLMYINFVWNNVNDNVELTNINLENIKDNIWDWKIVSLSSNTKLYAWKNPFTIWYYIDNRDDTKELKVDWNNNVNFDEWVKIFSINWDAYVETRNNISLKWQKIKDYLNLPLLPWTTITVDDTKENNFTEASHIDLVYFDSTENNLDLRDIKEFKINDLWVKSTSHVLFISENEDYYYSKLSLLKNNKLWTKSNQKLLAPQISWDKEEPEIDFNSTIRIPVYQKQRFNFTPYIYDNTWFSDFYIDYDLETDSDWDWNKTNDRDSDDKKTFVNKSNVSMDFWPYDYIFSHKIWLNFVDLAWNVAYKESSLEVYSPQPQIDSQSGKLFMWKIDEELLWEPINVYRYRFGTISRLLDQDWKQKTFTSQTGSYDFHVDSDDKKGLIISKNWIDVASINEHTWKITSFSLWEENIKALASNDELNDKNFVKIILEDNEWEIYYEYFDFSWLNELSLVRDFNNINSNWIYIKLEDYSNYSYYQIPFSAPYNPWVISIYSLDDANKTAIFSIFPNWEIYTSWKNYTLEYWTLWDNVVIKLLNKLTNKYMWEVLMKLDNGNYIIK